MKQMKLFSEKVVREFGGNLSKNSGKRKVERPLVFSKPMHLVLKTSRAKGRYAFSPTDHRVKALIQKMGRRFNVKIYSSAQNWSHIHLVLRLRDRNSYRAFIRALTGAMVLKLKAQKGFFDLTPYTKIASWGRQFKELKAYAEKNTFQALGIKLGVFEEKDLPPAN
jgi:REP element-mobilizing transposase RayT